MSQKQTERGTGFFGRITDEDLDRKLNQILAMLRIQAHQGIEIMADFTKVQETLAKTQTDVAALLAKASADDQAAVDAIDATLTTLNTQIEAFLNPPAAAPTPPAAEAPPAG